MLPDAGLTLRTARADDALAVWEWRNDPSARAASFSDAAIPYPEHEAWFATRLADPTTRILIAHAPDGAALGYVRFRVEESTAEISIGMAAASRGRGWGRAAIARASADLFAQGTVRCIVAHVKPQNEASLRAFAGAGFTVAAAGERVRLELVPR